MPELGWFWSDAGTLQGTLANVVEMRNVHYWVDHGSPDGVDPAGGATEWGIFMAEETTSI